MKSYEEFVRSMNEIHKANRTIHVTLSYLEKLKKDHASKIQLLDKKIEELSEAQDDEAIKEAIVKISGVKGELLFRYYIDGEPMKAIASSLNYTEANCWKLHKKGLQELYMEVKNETD